MKKNVMKKLVIVLVLVIVIIGSIFIINNNSEDKKQVLRAQIINKMFEKKVITEEELANDNCEYTVTENGNVYIDYYEGNKNSVVIPKEIDGKTVENIDITHFESNNDIEVIKVPKEISKNIDEIKNFEVNEELSDEDYIVYTTTQEYSEEYLKYLELSEEERSKVEAIPSKFYVPMEELYSNKMEYLYSTSTIDSEDLPEKFDLRSKIRIGVENQNRHGTCYAYATLTSVETNLDLRQGILEDFSEVHVGTLTSGYGGLFEWVNNYYFKKLKGPVRESVWSRQRAESIPSINRYLSGGGVTSDLYTYKNQMLQENVEYYVTNTIYFPSITGNIKNNPNKRDEVIKARNAIKKHIMNYGSLYAAISTNAMSRYSGNEITCCAYNNNFRANHAISIVGWDDNFSKERFHNSHVTEDGAYLALNSWGTSWGEGGYFWISYQDYFVETEMRGVIEVVGGQQKVQLTPDMFEVYGSFQYTGKPIEVKKNKIRFTYQGETKNGVYADIDIMGYKNNIEEGTGTVIIAGRGPFKGTVEVPFTIGNLKKIKYELHNYEGIYDGQEHGIEINVIEPQNATIKFFNSDEYYFIKDRDYHRNLIEILEPKRTDAGLEAFSYAIYANGYETVTGKAYINIKKKEIKYTDIILSQTEYIYDGTEKKPTVTVKDGNNDITYLYNINYINCVEPGIASIELIHNLAISMKKNYTCSVRKSYVIKNSETDTTKRIKFSATGYSDMYDGKKHGAKIVVDESIPNPTILYGEQEGQYTLTESPEYENMGMYYIYYKISANGYDDYEGKIDISILPNYQCNNFEIILNKETYIYTGNEIIPDVTVKVGKDILKPGIDYEIDCNNNINIGTADIRFISGKGNYSFSFKLGIPFYIINGIDIKVEGYADIYDRNSHTIKATANNPSSGVSIKYGLQLDDCTLNSPPEFTDVGTYIIYYKAIAQNYDEVTGSGQVKIEKAEINYMNISLETTEYLADGTPKTPRVIIKDKNNNILRENDDYECTYINNVETGIATVLVKGKNNYTGTEELTFNIYQNQISNEVLARNFQGEYDGMLHGIYVDTTSLGDNIEIMYGETQENYTEIRSPQFLNVGTYTVYYKITKPGMSDYKGSAQVVITPKNISEMTVYLSETEYIYDGTAKTPDITVTVNDIYELNKDVDYTVEYQNNTQVGNAKVIIRGQGNYTGTIEREFSIIQITLPNIQAQATGYNSIYDGQEHGITVNVTTPSNGAIIKYGSDRENYNSSESIKYSNVGTHYVYYRVTANGYRDYEGSAQVVITAKDLSGVSITLNQESFIYDGTAKTPIVTVKDGNKVLIKDIDYNVEYINNINKGTATVKITGLGNYTGVKSTQFIILDRLNVQIRNYEEKQINNVKYIQKIKPNESISNLKQNIITNGILKIYTNTNLLISEENKKLSTGMKTVIRKEDTNEEVTHKIVVMGDLNGDGKCSQVDLLKLSRFLAGLDNDLTGEYKLAANIHMENENINNADLLKMARVLADLETL